MSKDEKDGRLLGFPPGGVGDHGSEVVKTEEPVGDEVAAKIQVMLMRDGRVVLNYLEGNLAGTLQLLSKGVEIVAGLMKQGAPAAGRRVQPVNLVLPPGAKLRGDG